MSTPMSGASPQASDASVNVPRPSRNTRRRPSRYVIVYVCVYGQIPALDVQTREAGRRHRQSRP